jgi:hypothetical protein
VKAGTERPATVDSPGWLAPVAWTAWFALVDLSFQHPTLLVAAAPEQVEDAYIVAGSAPSSHSLNRATVMIVAGYGIAVAVPAGPVPTFDVAVTLTV